MMENSTRKVRPKYLDLLRIALPVTGWVSIAHRVSGVALVILLPLSIYGLDTALSGPSGFARAQQWCNSFPGILLVFGGALALVHHVAAGLRFLLLDIHIGAELAQASRVARWILMADGIFFVLLSAWFLL